MSCNDSKTCTKCLNILSISRFSPTKRNESGEVIARASWCTFCKTEQNRKRLGTIKRKTPLILDHAKECLRCNQVKSFDEFSPSKRGRNGLSCYCKQCAIRPTKEKARINTKKYREANRSRYLANHRISQFNRKSLLKTKSDGTITDEFINFVYEQNYCCWCDKYVESEERTLEHIVELSNGGLHSIHNINMACLSCNSSRINRNSEFNISSLFEKFNKEKYDNNCQNNC